MHSFRLTGSSWKSSRARAICWDLLTLKKGPMPVSWEERKIRTMSLGSPTRATMSEQAKELEENTANRATALEARPNQHRSTAVGLCRLFSIECLYAGAAD